MRIRHRRFIIFFAIVLISIQRLSTKSIADYCTETTERLKFLGSEESVTLDFAYDSFSPKNKIGEGGYGIVYLLKFPLSKLTHPALKYFESYINKNEDTLSIVVKKTGLSLNSLNEISAHKKLTEKGVGSAFFGCQYTRNNEVYIFQQKLDTHFFDDKFLERFMNFPPSKRLKHYRELFEQVFSLYDLNYVNNDIKVDNIMWDTRNERLIIIDFGMAQIAGTPIKSYGTQRFKSPGKFWIYNWRNPILVDLIDDLYSLAITIGYIESANTHVYIWKQGLAKNACDNDRSTECMNTIRRNVNSALRSLDPEDKTIAEINNKIIASDGIGKTNFKGLLWAILEYKKYKFDTEQILKIIEHEITRMELEEKVTEGEKVQNPAPSHELQIKPSKNRKELAINKLLPKRSKSTASIKELLRI